MEEEEDRWFFLRRLSEETGFDVSEIELHSDVLLDYQLDHDFYVNYTIEGRNGATETPLTLITVPVGVHEVNECETPGLTTFAAAVGW
jgi:8-oxo-dGTP pyrophosphatase MutT (NUDIX family)